MRHSFKVGLSFGTTSGIITTLGLMTGIHSTTHSKIALIGGILTIAIADAFSDALGIHISEESEEVHPPKQVWFSTIATFFSKFIFSIMFLIPVLIFTLDTAIKVSITWGLFLIAFLSYYISSEEHIKRWKSIFEHLFITVLVIAATHFVGGWIRTVFS